MSKLLEPYSIKRRYTQGAEILDNGIHFRIWAPARINVELVLCESNCVEQMVREEDGHWSILIDGIGAGTLYKYRLDSKEPCYPDPVARSLPQGPHGPAEVIDPKQFVWSDVTWPGASLNNNVIYEMHVGTFTSQGTWSSAAEKLAFIKELGVTVIEMMPVAEFCGGFGWGYDGVAWFAPYHHYGSPNDLRRFVNMAHQLGIAVILDVVYNHLGPDGNYLGQFSAHYFSDSTTEWGIGLNFDKKHSEGMRNLVIDNASYWIDEFHLDGLRLDATQNIVDKSKDHIIATLASQARKIAKHKTLLITAENEPQDSKLIRALESGGYGLDCVWNDDFHHSAVVSLTGRRQAYYQDYSGSAKEWSSTVKHGFLYQGQWLFRQGKSRGQSTRGLPSNSFITFLENHDQVSNSLWSERLWQQSNPGCFRAMTALLLLGPWTPLLFQGQEWSASSPFFYFSDHHPELAKLIQQGRAEFLSQFPGCSTEFGKNLILQRDTTKAFNLSKLNWDEQQKPFHKHALLFHKHLLKLRRNDTTLMRLGSDEIEVEVSTLSDQCGLLRYALIPSQLNEYANDQRLLIINLGPGLDLNQSTEPLLAPPEPEQLTWKMQWTSEDPHYGGYGSLEPLSVDHLWHIPGNAALLLHPGPRT